MTDRTRAALNAGIANIVRELTESASREIMVLMATSRGSRGLAFRQGLQNLNKRVPEYEAKLIDLHLDLGIRDEEEISDRIAQEFRLHIPAVAVSTAATLHGHEIHGAQRETENFRGWVNQYAASIAGRALVAVELRKRKDLEGRQKGNEDRDVGKHGEGERHATQSSLAGHLEFVRRIGRGVSASVWLAEDTKLRRKVVLKVLHESVPLPGQDAFAFGRALAKVVHPNVVTVHDVVEVLHPESHDPVMVVVMEYVEGSTLAERLSGPPLAGNEIERLGLGLIDAVREFHSQGRAHSDLHDENVMVDKSGIVKVLDPSNFNTKSLQKGDLLEAMQARDLRGLRQRLREMLRVSSIPAPNIATFDRDTDMCQTAQNVRSAFERALLIDDLAPAPPMLPREEASTASPAVAALGLSPDATNVGRFLLEEADEMAGFEPIRYGTDLDHLKIAPDRLNDAVSDLEHHGLVKVTPGMGAPFTFHNVESIYHLVGAVGTDSARRDQDEAVKMVVTCVVREKSISAEQLSRTTGLSPLRVNRAVAHLGHVLDVHGTPAAPFMFEYLLATASTRRYARENGLLKDEAPVSAQ